MKTKKRVLGIITCLILILMFLFTPACGIKTSYIVLSVSGPSEKESIAPTSEENIKTISEKNVKATSQNWEGVEEKFIPPMEGKNLLSFRGVDFYPYPNPYSSQEGLQSLESLLKIKELNWIQIRFFIYQEGSNSNKVRVDATQDEQLIKTIEQIHRSGRKVSLMPHFILDNDKVWGALIEPTNLEEWFSSYKEGIVHYAKLAQQEDVELFSVANEMISVWSQNKEWEKVITAVREVYNGKITAKMNSWWQEGYFRSILKMTWMSKLDYIGIAPYFDLTNKKDPTLEEIKKGWIKSRQWLNLVKELEMICEIFDKEMIFLEIGFRSVDGANIEPWNSENIVPRGSDSVVKVDQEEQALATQALFDVFLDKSWFQGVFWFYWPTKIVLNPNDTTWSIPGKIVEQVIWDNFRKERGGAE